MSLPTGHGKSLCCMSRAVVAGEPMGVAMTQGMLVVELPTGSLVLMLLLSLSHATPRMHKVTSNSYIFLT